MDQLINLGLTCVISILIGILLWLALLVLVKSRITYRGNYHPGWNNRAIGDVIFRHGHLSVTKRRI